MIQRLLSSRLGLALGIIYALLFLEGVREALIECPSFLCDLGLAVVTLPWAYMLEPAYSPFATIPTYPYNLIFYAIFGALNTIIVYNMGRGISFVWGRVVQPKA